MANPLLSFRGFHIDPLRDTQNVHLTLDSHVLQAIDLEANPL
jgi:hypothetical protein